MFNKFLLLSALVIAICGAAAPAAADGDQLIITNVGVGQIDPNNVVPAINSVTGAGVTNWDIATPIALLSGGQSYMFTAAFQDFSYTGTCIVSAAFTQIQNGKKVKLRSVTFSGSCEAGKTYLVSNKTGVMPNSPGDVTLTSR
jgi:hypothetical protein